MTTRNVRISTSRDGDFTVRADIGYDDDADWQTAMERSLVRRTRGAAKVRLAHVDASTWTYAVLNIHGGVLSQGTFTYAVR